MRKNRRMNNTWYKIKAEGPTTDILIHDEIGGWGVQSSAFISDLQTVKGPVTIRINSGGGDVFQGLAICNYLQQRGDVTTVCDGIAASAASLVFLGGAVRQIPESAFVMIHNPQMAGEGDAGDMRKNADLLDSIAQAMASIYARVTGSMSQSDALTLMENETWYDGLAARAAGFATHILEGSPVIASINPKWGYKKAPTALLSPAQKQASKTQKMNQTIASLFGIQAGAREKFLASAIEAVGIKADAIDTAEKDGKTAFLSEAITSRLGELNAKLTALTAELTTSSEIVSAIMSELDIKDEMKPDTAPAALKKALEVRASKIAAESLASRGIQSNKTQPTVNASVDSEISGLQLAIKLNEAKHSNPN